ncbi:MAG: SCO family protein [Actinomycetota bacterium]|nr:SCO family protein [Actinomycetota bacterium]
MTTRLKRILLAGGVAFLGVVFAWYFVLPRLQPHVFSGSVIQSNERAPRVDLQASNGETVRLSDFDDEVIVLYFGYTFCPDVCPTTLTKLADAVGILGDKADDVQVIMVSLDPERDTPEMLAEYVEHFHPDFMGVTGDPAAVNRVATVYGVYYEKEEGTAATGYLINHTATVMVVDKDGFLKLVLPFEGTAEQMADDIDFFL